VRIGAEVLQAIAAHAWSEVPNECCGLLVGGGGAIVDAVPARNVLAHPARYQIDPQDHIATNRRLRGTDRTVVGAYHSHPRSPAVPSPRDLEEAHYPEFVWLIVSLVSDPPEFRGYRIRDGRAVEIGLEV
jgi:[CysO sulfur-carrier protein]-S-L-cysteine hydrolase